MIETLRGALGRVGTSGSRWGPSRWRQAAGWIVAVVLAAAMCATVITAAPRNSPTIDEPGHLVRGLAFWWTDSRVIHWPHPPAGQALATVGAALAGREHREHLEKAVRGTDDFRRATTLYARAGYAELRQQLMWARYGMAALASLLGLGIFAWCRRRYDATTGWFVYLFYVTNTLLLAHAGLITTDFPIAAATVLAVMAVHRHITSSKGGLVAMALAVGLLAATKVSGLMIAAILAVPVVVTAIRGEGPYRDARRVRRIARVLGEGLLALLVIILCIDAVYLFEDTGLTVAEIVAREVPHDRFDEIAVMGESRWIGLLPDGLRVPLPWTYLYSIDFVAAQGQHGHGDWFLGERRGPGTPGYFVILLAAKLPVAIVALLLVGVIGALLRRESSVTTKLLVYVAGAFLIATFFARINIGVRHALPVVPVLTILAGRVAARLWSGGGGPGVGSVASPSDSRRRVGRLVAGLAVASAAVGAALSYPHYVADFNVAVGGREGGHKISVVGEDWGQDFVDLARWVEDERIDEVDYVKNSKIRVMELEHLGVPVRAIGCGAARPDAVVLVHLATYVRKDRCRAWLERAFVLRHVVNDHLMIFDWKRDDDDAANR